MKKSSTVTTARSGKGEGQKKDRIVAATGVAAQPGEFMIIPLAEIDPSPFNHRTIFPPAKMEELAASIALHGIIENLVVRRSSSGRYELVAGERRNRAARMAGLMEAPAILKELTDDEVKEIQLAENLQREDPHPLEQGAAIAELQTRYKTIDEVALRMGKSKTFVYTHLKLVSLIPDIREMFIAEKFTLKEVVEIAGLAPDSQQEFFNEYCADWREEDFDTPELSDVLDQFKYNLANAPFNIQDEGLLPEVGACTKCPFNTATLTSLFPDEEEDACCMNTSCFHRKCSMLFINGLRAALEEHRPEALLFYGVPSPFLKNSLLELPEAASLPQYNYHGVTVIHEVQLPRQEDYLEDLTGEEVDGYEPAPDLDGFAAAMEEYKRDLEEYHQMVEKGGTLKGLLITDRTFTPCLFTPGNPRRPGASAPSVTAAQVQAAINSGEVTPELLKAEIERIQTKEVRSKELDREKVQLALHEKFLAQIGDAPGNQSPTTADLAGAWLVIFHSLQYYTQRKLVSILFPDSGESDHSKPEVFYQKFSTLTDSQISYLIRVAVTARDDSKSPTSKTALFLHKMAEDAGVDTAAIEKEQQVKVAERESRQQIRIADLERRIGKIAA